MNVLDSVIVLSFVLCSLFYVVVFYPGEKKLSYQNISFWLFSSAKIKMNQICSPLPSSPRTKQQTTNNDYSYRNSYRDYYSKLLSKREFKSKMGLDDAVSDSGLIDRILETLPSFVYHYSELDELTPANLELWEKERCYTGYSIAFHLLYPLYQTVCWDGMIPWEMNSADKRHLQINVRKKIINIMRGEPYIPFGEDPEPGYELEIPEEYRKRG